MDQTNQNPNPNQPVVPVDPNATQVPQPPVVETPAAPQDGVPGGETPAPTPQPETTETPAPTVPPTQTGTPGNWQQ